ncbi:hypothetical protein BS17DRAFT_859745 [Gyrodon lividus]|nr:hypothetical protein BS17DRAFT_859745 [Gyrodon lividus]
MSRSNSSRNSQTSNGFPCCQGPVDLKTLDGTDKKTRKPHAKLLIKWQWQQFQKPTFTAAAMHLKDKFPNTSDAEKVGVVCQGKWTTPKAAYNAVMDIQTSGCTWSDEHSVLATP